jgi:hypothetical protein
MSERRPVFVLRLRALKDVDPLRALRWILKHMLRDYGMQAISCEEESNDKEIFNRGHPPG